MTYQIHPGDCRITMAAMPAASVDTIITDPPYGLDFMGKQWDAQVPGPEYWREALRVAKPGAMLLAFGGTRTFHRLTCAIEDAGWEIRDCLSWLYGSGFPKSLAIDKAIDKQRHDRAATEQVVRWLSSAREKAGCSRQQIEERFGTVNIYQGFFTITAGSKPRVPTLEQVPVLLELFGITADDVPPEIRKLLMDLNGLKGTPGQAWLEREVVGTKVMRDTTMSAPVSTDAQGLEGNPVRKVDITAPSSDLAKQWEGWGTALKPAWEPIVLAMKPLDGTYADNARMHGCAGLAIDAGRIGEEARFNPPASNTGETAASLAPVNVTAYQGKETVGRWPSNVMLDTIAADCLDGWGGGQLSRFFYVAKASRDERGTGNDHPTVKPLELMRYLARITRTPTGGTVLDPFCGSGTTGVGALMEGREFIGCELDPHNAEIADHRCAQANPMGRQLTIEGMLS